MKKKVLLILSVFCFVNFNKVHALELDYVDTLLDDTKYELVDTQKRYMWYYENLISLGYSNGIISSDTYVDKDDFIYEYSNWRNDNCDEKENIEFRNKYSYQKIKPLKYIEITSNNTAYISEIEVLVNDKKVNYKVACTECGLDEIKLLYDNSIDKDSYYTLVNRGKLQINLTEDYPMEEIKIKVYAINSDSPINYKIEFTEKPYQYDVNIYKENLNIDKKYDENISYEIFNIDDTWVFNSYFDEPKTTYDYLENSWHTKVQTSKECRDANKKYHYYKVERKYIDGYYLNSPNNSLILKRDDTKYKLYYKYKVKEENIFYGTSMNYKTNNSVDIDYSKQDTEQKVEENNEKNNLISDSSLKKKENKTDKKETKEDNKDEENEDKKLLYKIICIMGLILLILIFALKKRREEK